MRYICLVYNEESNVDALPASEYNAIVDETFAHRGELQREGHHIASSPLEPVRSAMTVRVQEGRVSVTEGPFAETREQLGGFYLIEAEDMSEAIRLASQMPPARLGSIEVRPLKELAHR